MSTNIPNKVPFLREQRLFPQEAEPLSIELDRTYTDIASSMNARTLGIYTSNNSTQNGESWYLNGRKYQGFRQFYEITPFPAAGTTVTFPTGIPIPNVFAFTNIRGTVKTSANQWFIFPVTSITLATENVALFVTPNIAATHFDIGIAVGAGSGLPFTTAYIVLEWITNA